MKLVDILNSELIKCPLQSSNKVSVIKELLSLLSEKQSIENKENILKAILDREAIMTTGVGNGVAIPHCKIANLSNFIMALGIHKEGIDFQSLDGEPAQIIFLLVGPEDKPGTHIRLLSRVSRILSKADVRERMIKSDAADVIFQHLAEEENLLEVS